MVSTVVLIMNIDSALLFESLARCTAVWIADIPTHAAFKNLLSSEKSGLSITWFPLRPAEQLGAAAVRIAFSLDDHFNDDAQSRGYRSLLVFGAQHDLSMNVEFATLGFRHLEPTDFGFIAAK